jgi:hypothetical protein
MQRRLNQHNVGRQDLPPVVGREDVQCFDGGRQRDWIGLGLSERPAR